MTIAYPITVATKALPVTPSDSTVLNCAGIYVGGAGDVAVTMIDDSSAVTLSSVPAGSTLPFACKHVMETNTTATNIVALYV